MCSMCAVIVNDYGHESLHHLTYLSTSPLSTRLCCDNELKHDGICQFANNLSFGQFAFIFLQHIPNITQNSKATGFIPPGKGEWEELQHSLQPLRCIGRNFFHHRRSSPPHLHRMSGNLEMIKPCVALWLASWHKINISYKKMCRPIWWFSHLKSAVWVFFQMTSMRILCRVIKSPVWAQLWQIWTLQNLIKILREITICVSKANQQLLIETIHHNPSWNSRPEQAAVHRMWVQRTCWPC